MYYQMANNKASAVWDVMETFYRCLSDFIDQHDIYEERVLDFAQKYKVDRTKLELKASEIATLIDQDRLGHLRDESLFDLKERAHLVFRTPAGNDDFDRFVSEIYHELSVLREEHYSIKTYMPDYEKGPHRNIAETILLEANDLFPRKMNTVRELFEKARFRLEELMPSWNREPVFIRPLYLFGNDFLPRKIYGNGIENLYEIMYKDCGVVEGYFEVARSFYESGFLNRAKSSLRKAKAKLINGKGINSEKNTQTIHKQIEQLDKLIEEGQSLRTGEI